MPRPGEVSLAHRGVLFFDELPEFDRRVLEVLREPLESQRVTISRAARQADFPADFQFVAAMNPCPCGYAGDPSGRCSCGADRVARYLGRISGPLLDRLDIQLEVGRDAGWLRDLDGPPPETTALIRSRVQTVRAHQLQRQGCLNARLGPSAIVELAAPDARGRRLLEVAFGRFNLSPRTYHRLLKLARTCADLETSPQVTSEHLAEALTLRRLEVRANTPR